MLEDVLLFMAIGFAAQVVDGALGMAYGLTATSVLLGLGVPPVTASASVHAAEVFTTAASGASHWRLGNVDLTLVRRLALPGMLGGAVGAYLLTEAPGDLVAPLVNLYLLCMGGVILWRALHLRRTRPKPMRRVGLLGLAGGFLDAIGGGGWGPLVNSTLIGRGTLAREAIGSTSLSEFFVTSTVSATFIFAIGLDLWPVIAGLVLGGVVAAPFAAYVVRQLPDRPLMIMVAVLIILLSIRGLLQAL